MTEAAIALLSGDIHSTTKTLVDTRALVRAIASSTSAARPVFVMSNNNHFGAHGPRAFRTSSGNQIS